MPLEQVTKEQWLSWKEHPITEHFFEMLRSRREDIIEMLAYGNVENPKKQDIMLGAVGAYTHVLGITFTEENE